MGMALNPFKKVTPERMDTVAHILSLLHIQSLVLKRVWQFHGMFSPRARI
jgi:hypothetical protein